MLIIEYWTPTLFTYQKWETNFGLVTQSSNTKQSCMAKFPLFWNIIDRHSLENSQSTASSLNFHSLTLLRLKKIFFHPVSKHNWQNSRLIWKYKSIKPRIWSLMVIYIQETSKYIKLNSKNSVYKHSTASNGYYECFLSFASQKVVIICNFDDNCNQMKTWFSKTHLYTQVAKISELRNIARKGSQIKQQYKSLEVEKK